MGAHIGTHERLAILDARSGIQLDSYGSRKELAEGAVFGLGLEFETPEEHIGWVRGLADRLAEEYAEREADANSDSEDMDDDDV